MELENMPDEKDNSDENPLGLGLSQGRQVHNRWDYGPLGKRRTTGPGLRHDRHARPGILSSKLALCAAAAIFLTLSATAQQMGGPGTLVPTSPSTAVSPTGPLSFTPAKVLNPKDPPFNALCDGSTDDSAALTRWAGAITTGTHAVIPGSCIFGSPLRFPSVDQVTLDGGGALIYRGTATTGNILNFGAPNVTSGCSMREWSIRNVRFLTNTAMTNGFGVTFNEICDGELSEVTFGGQFGGSNSWYNAVHFNGGNTLHVRGSVVTGRNDGITINGDSTYQFSDPYFHQVKIVGLPDVGLRIAGEVGGLTIDHADVLENGENVRIDQSQIAVPNTQLFFGPGMAMDATNLSTVASFTGSISGATLRVSSVSSGAMQVGNAIVGTSITGNPLILSQITGTTGGTGTYLLNMSEGTVASEAMTTQGSGIGLHIVDPGNIYSTLTLANTWLATATNQLLLVDSAVTNWIVNYYGGDILNGNDYANGPAMIDNESTAAGVSILFSGSHFSACCNGGKYAIFNASSANPIQLQGVAFSLTTANRVNGSASGTWTDGTNLYSIATGGISQTAIGTVLISSSGSYIKLTSDQNVTAQALAGDFVVIGAGTTNAYCGFWIGANVIPGYMDSSAAGCALNLGTSTYPFSDIENKTQTINDPSRSDRASLTVKATSNVDGVNLKLTGNGSTTPTKYIRIYNGSFNIVNSGYSATIMSLTDAGVLNAPAFSAAGTAGVSCSGTPSSSFATVNGIVTHC
jgi:hypothetical protein